MPYILVVSIDASLEGVHSRRAPCLDPLGEDGQKAWLQLWLSSRHSIQCEGVQTISSWTVFVYSWIMDNLGSCKQIELIWQSTVGRESYTPIKPSKFSLTKFLICFVLQMNNFYNLVFSLILLPLFYVLAYFEKQRKLEYHISQNIGRNWKAETFTHN